MKSNSEYCPQFKPHHFLMYYWNRLSPAHRQELEAHCFDCEPCLNLWNYVGRIVNGQETTSWEENAFIIKMFASPIWEHVEAEMAEDIKADLINHFQIGKDDETVLTEEERNELAKTNAKGVSSPSPAASKRKHKIAALFASVAVLAGISLFAYLHNSRQAKESLKEAELDSIVISEPKFTISLSEKLNSELDAYLANRSEQSKSQVLMTAKQMRERGYGNYFIDLVEWYSSVEESKVPQLRYARSLISDLEVNRGKTDYTSRLSQVNTAAAIFSSNGAELEVPSCDNHKTRLLIQFSKYEEASAAINRSLELAHKLKSNYHESLLKLNLALLKIETNRSEEAIEALNASMKCFADVGESKPYLRAAGILGSLYFAVNDDLRAYQIYKSTLYYAEETGDEFRQMQICQMLGVTAHNLGYQEESRNYIARTLALGDKHNSNYIKAYTCALSSLIEAESGDMKLASARMEDAYKFKNAENDSTARAVLDFYVTGYNGRLSVIAGDLKRAEDLYRYALSLAPIVGIEQKLLLSQLHHGIADTYIARGDYAAARQALEVAAKLENDSIKRSEKANLFLRFAASPLSAKEEMAHLDSLER